MQKKIRARDTVGCSNVFLCAGNNPGVLKNSTEHAEPFLGLFQKLTCGGGWTAKKFTVGGGTFHN